MQHTIEYHEIPDGFMIPGPHGQTPEESAHGGTRSSVYLVVSRGEACLIDTGYGAGMAQGIQDLVRRAGCRVTSIVLTHDHYDHVANAARLARRFGSKVHAHARDLPLIRDPLMLFKDKLMVATYGASYRQAVEDLDWGAPEFLEHERRLARHFAFPQAVDVALEDRSTIPVGEITLEVLHTPGHSPGSITLYSPLTRSAYAGDLLFWINPARPAPIGNVADLQRSLRRVAELDIAYLGWGHYEGIRGKQEADRFLKDLMGRVTGLEGRILAALPGARGLRIEELAEALFPILPRDNYHPIPELSLQAYQRKLLDEGKVRREPGGGAVRWTRAPQQ
jgi:glyoxylase-like metal-dependent hydrolase (beta-lactamase superfamily II)